METLSLIYLSSAIFFHTISNEKDQIGFTFLNRNTLFILVLSELESVIDQPAG